MNETFVTSCAEPFHPAWTKCECLYTRNLRTLLHCKKKCSVKATWKGLLQFQWAQTRGSRAYI